MNNSASHRTGQQSFDQTADSRGFSLVELLVALALGIILMLAAALFTMQQVELQSVRTDVASVQQKARLSLEIILSELRMAGYDPTEDSGAGFITATASVIGFSADRNGDGDISDPGEVMTFGLYDPDDDGVSDLGLDRGGGYQLLASNVTGVGIIYTLADGTETSTPTDLTAIRSVKVSLTTVAERTDRLLNHQMAAEEAEEAEGQLTNRHQQTLSGLVSLPNLNLD